MWEPKPEHPLRRLFAGLTEQTFINTFGLADPQLTDYLSNMLSRFIHVDALHRLHSVKGKRLEEVAEMMIEAEELPEGRTRREVHRHIGDFALFWTGVFPERGAGCAGAEQGPFHRLLRAGQTLLLHRQHLRRRSLSRGSPGAAPTE